MKRPSLWLLLVLLALPVLAYAIVGGGSPMRSSPGGAAPAQARSGPSPTYSDLITRAKQHPGSIRLVVFDPNTRSVAMTLKNGSSLRSHYPSDQAQVRFQSLLEKEHVAFTAAATRSGSSGVGWLGLLGILLPAVLLGALILLFLRRGAGSGANVPKGLMGVGRAKARRLVPGMPSVTFADVAGLDEAVDELQEIKEFLRRPEKFRAVGARIPKGVLLYGPPGTGKTLLARAVAGEAGVPFFSISASEFVEVFVGVGASRVRDLFKQAKQAAPAIVFVDEIDAVGRHRGAGMGGGHDEREQTLNQLLVELDGFEPTDNVIVMAATNRSDVLDPALLRPGRFDRQTAAGLPDRGGRRQILEVHTRGKPLDDGIDLDRLAAGTPGFSGADLANLVNEAALLTARRGVAVIGAFELEEGVMRVMAGRERRTRILSERERRITAYHETGHALVGQLLPNTDPVHRISIISRGRALGLTIALPDEERFLTTRSALLDRLAMTLAGHAAEQLVFHEVTTGAADDLRKATGLARQMVLQFGMSSRLGLRVLDDGDGGLHPFAGRNLGLQRPLVSEELTREADEEIHGLLDQAHEIARSLLDLHRKPLDRIAALLVERETIEGDEFERILVGEVAAAHPLKAAAS